MANLLFITLDDLASMQAWPLYDDIVITPNLDAFQARSTHFSNAYADVAVCNPSRAALLTGQKPWDKGVISNKQTLRDHIDLVSETLPGILKTQGYHTAIGGKVFHDFRSDDQTITSDEIIPSAGLRYARPADAASVGILKYGATDRRMADDVLADNVAGFLEGYDQDQPFALFAGIFRPHFDWVVPQAYIDMYDGIDIPIPDFVDESERAIFTRVMRADFHNRVLDQGAWQDLVKHYLASITYADARLGDILDALAASPHADTTMIMVMADHGYHLGDTGLWHKNTTYDQSARVPLMVAGADILAQDISAPVNLSNMAATALELLGMDVPEQMQPSVAGLIRGDAPTGDEYAVTWMQASLSVRTETYRYSRYANGEEELYHMATDVMQERNVIDQMPDIAAQMRMLADQETSDDLFIRPDGPVHGSAADSYYILARNPVAITDDGGHDRVQISVDYILPDGIEDLEAINFIDGLKITGNGSNNYISGSQAGDTLLGLDGDDTLHGEHGDDKIGGGRGDDTVFAGFGDDTAWGGGGNDTLLGQVGDDRLYGRDGADVLRGGVGKDWLDGDAGNDVLEGDGSRDTLMGGLGNDSLNGGQGWDIIDGGEGTDTAIFSGLRAAYTLISGDYDSFVLEGVDGRDTLSSVERLQFDDLTVTTQEFFGPGAAQVVIGTDRSDRLEGGTGNDQLFGGRGNDRLLGHSFDDYLHGGRGNDLIYGGQGQDTISYAGAGGTVIVDLANGWTSGAFGSDTFFNIEHVEAGQHDDFVYGSAEANDIRGHRGADRLYGAAGDDALFGGDGSDLLAGGQGDDRLYGGAGADRVFGGNGRDVILGGSDADDLFGNLHGDVLRGGTGDDRLNGGRGADVIFGDEGDDALHGALGSDTMTGGVGQDRLFGGTGEDTLHGGIGDDILFGGNGGRHRDGQRDVFVFLSEDTGSDRIEDFETGIDVLDLRAFGFSEFETDVLPRATLAEGDTATRITLATDVEIILANVILDQFAASDVWL